MHSSSIYFKFTSLLCLPSYFIILFSFFFVPQHTHFPGWRWWRIYWQIRVIFYWCLNLIFYLWLLSIASLHWNIFSICPILILADSLQWGCTVQLQVSLIFYISSIFAHGITAFKTKITKLFSFFVAHSQATNFFYKPESFWVWHSYSWKLDFFHILRRVHFQMGHFDPKSWLIIILFIRSNIKKTFLF